MNAFRVWHLGSSSSFRWMLGWWIFCSSLKRCVWYMLWWEFGKKSSLSKYIFRLELYISIHRVSTMTVESRWRKCNQILWGGLTAVLAPSSSPFPQLKHLRRGSLQQACQLLPVLRGEQNKKKNPWKETEASWEYCARDWHLALKTLHCCLWEPDSLHWAAAEYFSPYLF